jgi:RNA polymerase sigma-70 factor (ECF subfamily)
VSSITARELATSRDEALVGRAAAGDRAAFDALVASRLDRCYRLAWAILANEADAADATQDAFVAAWRQLPRLRDPRSFDPWLNRIVANAARMSRRHRARVREVPMPGWADEGAEPVLPSALRGTGGMERVPERDAIGRAFDGLKPDERAILLLHHVDERPVAEIARGLGIPGGTAKWRLHAARRSLERLMEAER